MIQYMLCFCVRKNVRCRRRHKNLLFLHHHFYILQRANIITSGNCWLDKTKGKSCKGQGKGKKGEIPTDYKTPVCERTLHISWTITTLLFMPLYLWRGFNIMALTQWHAIKHMSFIKLKVVQFWLRITRTNWACSHHLAGTMITMIDYIKLLQISSNNHIRATVIAAF